jgi:hypothetical protein
MSCSKSESTFGPGLPQALAPASLTALPLVPLEPVVPVVVPLVPVVAPLEPLEPVVPLLPLLPVPAPVEPVFPLPEPVDPVPLPVDPVPLPVDPVDPVPEPLLPLLPVPPLLPLFPLLPVPLFPELLPLPPKPLLPLFPPLSVVPQAKTTAMGTISADRMQARARVDRIIDFLLGVNRVPGGPEKCGALGGSSAESWGAERPGEQRSRGVLPRSFRGARPLRRWWRKGADGHSRDEI